MFHGTTVSSEPLRNPILVCWTLLVICEIFLFILLFTRLRLLVFVFYHSYFLLDYN